MVVTTADVDAPYTTSQRWVILSSAILGYVTDGYNLLIITFLLPSVTKDLHISTEQAGLIVTAQLVASILGGALFGRLADARGRKSALTWSIALFSVGALLSAFSYGYSSLLITRIVAGIGLGGEWGVGMALFNEAWTKHRGLGASVIQSALPVGSLLAGVVAAQIIADQGPSGWRLALGTGCVPIVLCLVIRVWMQESRVWLRSRRDGVIGGGKGAGAVAEIVRSGSTRRWFLGFGLVLGYMISFYGVTSWMPTFIVQTFHQGPSVWREVNTYAVWVVIPLKIAFGLWGDHVGRKIATVVPALFTLAGSVGLLVLGLATDHGYPGSIWSWSLFWFFFIWSMGNAQASLMGAWLPESFPTKIRATATSTTYMFGRGLSALAPSLVVVLGFRNLGVGMGTVSLLGVVVFLCCAVLLPETKPARRRQAVIEDETEDEAAGRPPSSADLSPTPATTHRHDEERA